MFTALGFGVAWGHGVQGKPMSRAAGLTRGAVPGPSRQRLRLTAGPGLRVTDAGVAHLAKVVDVLIAAFALSLIHI